MKHGTVVEVTGIPNLVSAVFARHLPHALVVPLAAKTSREVSAILIRNGRVVDPLQRLDSMQDILIDNGRIVAMGDRLDTPGSRMSRIRRDQRRRRTRLHRHARALARTRSDAQRNDRDRQRGRGSGRIHRGRVYAEHGTRARFPRSHRRSAPPGRACEPGARVSDRGDHAGAWRQRTRAVLALARCRRRRV